MPQLQQQWLNPGNAICRTLYQVTVSVPHLSAAHLASQGYSPQRYVTLEAGAWNCFMCARLTPGGARCMSRLESCEIDHRSSRKHGSRALRLDSQSVENISAVPPSTVQLPHVDAPGQTLLVFRPQRQRSLTVDPDIQPPRNVLPDRTRCVNNHFVAMSVCMNTQAHRRAGK